MEVDGNWCLIESDPGVFTDLIRNFGVSGVQVEELYSLDDESCSLLKPIHGLIFLYKWRAGDEPMGQPAKESDQVYFAQQVITNACATQAIINLLLNVHHDDVKLGDILTEFKSFTKDFAPADRGLVLGNSDQIRTVHNSYGRTQLYEVLQPTSTKDDDVFHFVTYVPIRGKVYELDGLREAPLEVAVIAEGQDWMDAVRPVINQRIAKYSQGEIHFNLLAMVKDRRMKIREQLELLGDQADPTEIARLHEELTTEDEKEARWKLENKRRRHNYIPFIVELLRVMAKEDLLVPLVKEAIDKKKVDDSAKKQIKTETKME